MEEHIKVIKCPNCGSGNNEFIRENHYRCTSCNTEYFVEKNEMNVNVRHTFEKEPISVSPKKVKATIFAVVVGVISFFLFLYIADWISGDNKQGGGAVGKTEWRYFNPMATNLIEIDNKPYFILYATRKFGYEKEEKGYYFYDIDEDKVDKFVELEGRSATTRRFADGNYYLELDGKQLFRLNKSSLIFEDYSPIIRVLDPAFSTGFVSIKLTYRDDGQSFDIVSNVGDEYRYYPIVNALYTKDESYKMSYGKEGILPQARDTTYHIITKSSMKDADTRVRQPSKLLCITKKYNAGGPESEVKTATYSSKWGKYSYFDENRRVSAYTDLTPDRSYIDGSLVIYENANDLLIRVKATVAEDAALSIQKINKQTGDIEWSTMVRTPKFTYGSSYDQSMKIGDRYILKDGDRSCVILDKDGKLLKEVDL